MQVSDEKVKEELLTSLFLLLLLHFLVKAFEVLAVCAPQTKDLISYQRKTICISAFIFKNLVFNIQTVLTD